LLKFISAFDQARGENPCDQVICYPGHITKISEIKTYLWHPISSLFISNIPNHFLTFLPNNKGAEMNVAVNAIGQTGQLFVIENISTPLKERSSL